jgi:hypothetical protein
VRYIIIYIYIYKAFPFRFRIMSQVWVPAYVPGCSGWSIFTVYDSETDNNRYICIDRYVVRTSTVLSFWVC